MEEKKKKGPINQIARKKKKKALGIGEKKSRSQMGKDSRLRRIENERLAKLEEETKERHEKIMVKLGRRSEFDLEIMFSKYEEYIAKCTEEWEKLLKSEGETAYGINMSWDRKLKVKLPSIEGYANYVGVGYTHLYDREKKHEGMKAIMDALRSEQCERLIDGGISGRYSGVIAKLLLSKHGYIEKTENDTNLKGGIAINFGRPSSPFNTKISNEDEGDNGN